MTLSAVTRAFSVVTLLVLTSCVTSSESGYKPAAEEIADICTAAIRFRLAAAPLPAHRELNIFMDGGVVSGLPARLSEYQVRLHSGGAGSPPPATRWYWLRLGRVTSKQAFVAIRGTRAPLKALELRKRDGKWSVAYDGEMILTYRAETPNHAMQRTALGVAIQHLW